MARGGCGQFRNHRPSQSKWDLMRAIDQLEYDSVDGPGIISVSGHYRRILPPMKKSQAGLRPVSCTKGKLYLNDYNVSVCNSVCSFLSLSVKIILPFIHPSTPFILPPILDRLMQGVLNDIHHQNCSWCESMSESKRARILQRDSLPS